MRALRSLVVLEIQRTRVTDGGLVHLKDLVNLEYLDLSETEITDAGIPHLLELKRLKLLKLPMRVTENAKARLREAIPGLKFEGRPEDFDVAPK